MILEELAKTEEKTGSYAGVRFNKATTDAVVRYCKDNKIENPVKADDVHTTLLYSKKYCPDYEPAGKLKAPMIGKPTEFHIWESRDSKSRYLVLQYTCPDLLKRHNELMDEHDATYDFPEFKAHITFSDDAGDVDVKTLPKFKHELVITEEYGEDLH